MNRLCARHHERLIDWVEGELDDAARGELAEHAEHCAECGGAAEFHARLRAELREAHSPLPPQVYFEGVLAQIHRRMPTPLPAAPFPKRRRIRREHAATAALGLMLVICLGSGLGSIGLQRGGPGPVRTAARSATEHPAALQVAAGPRLVAVEGMGIFSEDSPMLKLSPRELRELGYLLPERRKGAIMAQAHSRRDEAPA